MEVECEDCEGSFVWDHQQSYGHLARETRNKHQYAVSTFSVWRKKAEVNEETEQKNLNNLVQHGNENAEYYEDTNILDR